MKVINAQSGVTRGSGTKVRGIMVRRTAGKERPPRHIPSQVNKCTRSCGATYCPKCGGRHSGPRNSALITPPNLRYITIIPLNDPGQWSPDGGADQTPT